MRFPPFLSVIATAVACSLSPEPTGTADVLGQVLQSTGQPFANTTVVIACTDVATSTASTDAEGWYGANLHAPRAGSIRCVFAVPDMATPRIRVDTAMTFGPDGWLHALQHINLSESGNP